MITRRQFVKAVSMFGIALPLAPVMPAPAKVGYISAETHPEYRAGTKIFLDGADVTRDSFAADDIRGMVWRFAVDGQGRHILEVLDRDDKVVREVPRGARLPRKTPWKSALPAIPGREIDSTTFDNGGSWLEPGQTERLKTEVLHGNIVIQLPPVDKGGQ